MNIEQQRRIDVLQLELENAKMLVENCELMLSNIELKDKVEELTNENVLLEQKVNRLESTCDSCCIDEDDELFGDNW